MPKQEVKKAKKVSKSVLKRNRQNKSRRSHNKYYIKTLRDNIKKLRATKDKKEAIEMLPKVFSLIDKLAKKGMIHKNKAANLKSKLSKKINKLESVK